MLEQLATTEDVKTIATFLAENLPAKAKKLSKGHHRPQGREVWTKAIWCCFDSLRKKLDESWCLFPEEMPKRSGRAKGEYLVDFMLTDAVRGPRIACESEFGGKDWQIEWAIRKLYAVKSDIKIFIFEYGFTKDGRLPEEVGPVITDYLSNHGHFLPGEQFLVIQLDQQRSRHFVWAPNRRGPFKANEVQFKPLFPANS